jgi:hypothetical protein
MLIPNRSFSLPILAERIFATRDKKCQSKRASRRIRQASPVTRNLKELNLPLKNEINGIQKILRLPEKEKKNT